MHAAEAANYALIATILLLAAHVVQLLVEKRRKRAPKVAKPTSQFLQDAAPVLIVFASVTGTSRKLAGRPTHTRFLISARDRVGSERTSLSGLRRAHHAC